MQGNIRDFSLPEVLQFLALGRRDGVLELMVSGDRHWIFVRNGVIVGVNAAQAGTLRVLAEASLVPAGELEAALGEAQREGRDLGAVLTQRGLVSALAWQRFVQRELERLLYRLFSLKDSAFSFQAIDSPPLPPLTIHLPVDRAVLFGTRWAEVWTGLRPEVPSPHAVYGRGEAAEADRDDLLPVDRLVMDALERHSDVQRAAAKAGISLLEAAESVSRLVASGRARLISPG